MISTTARSPAVQRWLPRIGPPTLYLAVALLFWGLPIAAHPRGLLIAPDALDSSGYIWMLGWWPHALLHGINPFVTHEIFVPEGYNLAWVASIPLPSLALAPITLTLGPSVSWNALALLAPALSAWTAFLLCRRLCASTGPALVGGFLFGFSPYMGAHIAAAPQQALAFLLPVLVLLALRLMDGSLSPGRFVLMTALTLVAQFLISTEVMAMGAFFGAGAILVALIVWPSQRAKVGHLVLWFAVSGVAAAVLLSPVFYYLFVAGHTTPVHALQGRPADLASMVVPGTFMALKPPTVPGYASGLAYIGIPLTLIVGLFGWQYRREPLTRLLVACFAIAVVASLGSELLVAGHRTGLPLPWALFEDLPILRYALTVRFAVFFLIPGAVIAALWLSRRPSWRRWTLAGLAVLSFVPAIGDALWSSTTDNPPFISAGLYHQVLKPQDHVLFVPTMGSPMRWQAEEGFPFKIAGGYVGAFPPSYLRYPTFRTVLSGRLSRDYAADLRTFVRDKGVTAVVVRDNAPGPWRQLFGTLGVTPVRMGGVIYYRVR